MRVVGTCTDNTHTSMAVIVGPWELGGGGRLQQAGSKGRSKEALGKDILKDWLEKTFLYFSLAGTISNFIFKKVLSTRINF